MLPGLAEGVNRQVCRVSRGVRPPQGRIGGRWRLWRAVRVEIAQPRSRLGPDPRANLTAASYVVLFDPWWNPAVESQAIDRTHRIGQTRHVMAYRLLMRESIEQKIRALQKQKGALVADVLGEEKFAQSLTLEDLRFLFAD